MTAATPTEFRSARLMCDAHGAASACVCALTVLALPSKNGAIEKLIS